MHNEIIQVLFRSNDFSSALDFYNNLINIFDGSWVKIFSKEYIVKVLVLIALYGMCLKLPNSFQLISYRFKDKKYYCSKEFKWFLAKINNLYIDVVLILIIISYWLRITLSNQTFIYYQF